MERPTKEKDEKRAYAAEDCEETGYGMCLTGKVIVVCQDAFPDGCGNQLYFCTGGSGAEPDSVEHTVSGVSLENGEVTCFRRSQFLGTLSLSFFRNRQNCRCPRSAPSGRSH